MRIDWVPYSASSLVAGATMLLIGALLMPATESTADLLKVVEDETGRWLAVSGLYFLASAALIVGLPSALMLFEEGGVRTGLVASAVLVVGAIGTGGYAMLLAFFQALVEAEVLSVSAVDAVSEDPGFLAFLYGWIGAFYLGELLLAIALLMAGSTPRWVPGLLLAHVALLPVSSFIPAAVQPFTAILVTVALSGVGIAASTRRPVYV